MPRIFIVFFLFSCALDVRAQGLSVDGLVAKPIPTSDQVREMRGKGRTFEVLIEDGEVHYRSFDYGNQQGDPLPFKLESPPNNPIKFGGRKTLFALDHDWLLGTNMGEWGGHLYWFNQPGNSYYELVQTNVVDIHRVGKKILVTTGLAHLSSSHGNVLEVSRQDSLWVASSFADLSSAPYCCAVTPDQQLMVITSNNLVLISPDGSTTTLIKNGFWGDWLRSTSIVFRDDLAYIGMRGGVFCINLKDPTHQQWLTNR